MFEEFELIRILEEKANWIVWEAKSRAGKLHTILKCEEGLAEGQIILASTLPPGGDIYQFKSIKKLIQN